MKRIADMLARASFVGILLLSILALSGFYTSGQAHAENVPQVPQPTTNKQLAAAYLGHAARGSAQLSWSSANNQLTVVLNVSGLQAQTVHPAYIHAGTCASNGAIIYQLSNVVANAAGNAVSTTVINGITGGIPATGWHINVHVGPTLATLEQGASVACGNITNSSRSSSVIATLGVTTSPNQRTYGVSLLALKGTTLIVYTTVYHLVPGSSHAAHIHVGNCEYQTPGDVLYTLTELKANQWGVARSVTTIPGIEAIPTAGWYINIHYGTDLSTQVGYDIINCGNVNIIY